MDGFTVTTINRTCIHSYTQPYGVSCPALSEVLLNVLSTWIPRPKCSSESPPLLRRPRLHIQACWFAFTPEQQPPPPAPLTCAGLSIGNSTSDASLAPVGAFSGPLLAVAVAVAVSTWRVFRVVDESQLCESLWRHQLALRGVLTLLLGRDKDEGGCILDRLLRKSGQQTGRQEQRIPIPPVRVKGNTDISALTKCYVFLASTLGVDCSSGTGRRGLTDRGQQTTSPSDSTSGTVGRGRTHSIPL